MPITILVSSDSYLLDRAFQNIKKQVLDPGVADFNFDRYLAVDDEVSKMLEACEFLPMMAVSRLVWVREAQNFSKNDLLAFEKYFSNPSSTTHLVFTATKIDKRLSLWQKAHKKGWIQEFKVPFPNQMPAWLQNEARNKNLVLHPLAAQALLDSFGQNLQALMGVLDQLELYLHPRKKIEPEDVEVLVGSFLSKTVFDFTDQIGKKNFRQAEILLDQILTQGEPVVRLLFMIIRHFRLLKMAQEGVTQKWDERQLAGKMGVNPFFIKDYVTQAKKISQKTLERLYGELLMADRALKQSSVDGRFVLDRFLMQACFA